MYGKGSRGRPVCSHHYLQEALHASVTAPALRLPVPAPAWLGTDWTGTGHTKHQAASGVEGHHHPPSQSTSYYYTPAAITKGFVPNGA